MEELIEKHYQLYQQWKDINNKFMELLNVLKEEQHNIEKRIELLETAIALGNERDAITGKIMLLNMFASLRSSL